MFIRLFMGMIFLIVAMLYLSSLNPETILFHPAPGVTFPIYTSLLVLSSMGLGPFSSSSGLPSGIRAAVSSAGGNRPG